MGAGNVKLVFAVWGDLPHAPFRMLAYMALRSMDSDDPPRFWGGREELAYAIGRPVPEGKDEAANRERKTIFGAVKDTQRALKARGAITLLKDAGPGQNAVFAINLRTPIVGGSQTPPGVAQSPPVGGSQTSPVGGSEPGNGGVSDPSLGEEEEVEEEGRKQAKTEADGSDAARRGRAAAPPRPETFAEFEQRHRAIMVLPREELSEDDERFVASTIAQNYVIYIVGDPKNGVEMSTIEGMLSNDVHPKAIVNTILKGRGESPADHRKAVEYLQSLPDNERQAYKDAADAHVAAHFSDAGPSFATIFAARLAQRERAREQSRKAFANAR